MKCLTPCSASVTIENSINGLFKNLTQGFDTSCVKGLNLFAWPPIGMKHLSSFAFILRFNLKPQFIFSVQCSALWRNLGHGLLQFFYPSPNKTEYSITQFFTDHFFARYTSYATSQLIISDNLTNPPFKVSSLYMKSN